MIETFQSLIEAMLAKAWEDVSSVDMVHRPTIGEMFENISHQVLKAPLTATSLCVSRGFIQASNGKMSPELDCIVSTKAGTPIPYSDKLTHRPSDVIAVLQIKKELTDKAMQEGLENLFAVGQFPSEIERSNASVRYAFQSILRKKYDPELAKNHGGIDSALYNLLVVETVVPARILWGHFGPKNEQTLRHRIERAISPLLKTERSHPAHFPNLVVGGDYWATKLLGVPYACPMSGYGIPYIATGKSSPYRAILETIWSKLNLLGMIGSEIFGDDQVTECLSPLIFLRHIASDDGAIHWAFAKLDVDHSELIKRPDASEWTPVFLNNAQHDAACYLCSAIKTQTSDQYLVSIAKAEGITVEELIKPLVDGGLVSLDGVKVGLLTDSLSVFILPDGRNVAGENSSGRLLAWVKLNVNQRKR